MPGHRFVSFLSDYGLADEFVGVCKGVVLDLAPDARIVDLTHDIAPHDVRGGALTLVRAAPYLPSGVLLAVVDPGVGTDRRALAVEVEHGVLVGPDNGLLAPAVALMGGPVRVVALTNPDYQLVAPGPTFAGRDVFAPAAGHLAAGVPIGELGEEVDPASLVPGLLPLPGSETTERSPGRSSGSTASGTASSTSTPTSCGRAGRRRVVPWRSGSATAPAWPGGWARTRRRDPPSW
ncbi:MAG: SAM-dependent chlorinase/fluorinase [Acidimicrobiia bacterium]|nr:SAM-dependent chlorinase/fluorinase [Acidimicrobiia bacterium]